MAARTKSGVSSCLILAAVCCAAVLAAGLAGGCGSGGSGGSAGGASSAATAAASPAAGSDVSGDLIDVTGDATPAAAADRAEIERRLALPRFTYVAETDARSGKFKGALAIIDSETDKLAYRPRFGKNPNTIAVAPDGRLVYVTDFDAPVVHVVDAETYNEVRTVRLPGVKASTRAYTAAGTMCYADMQGCSSAVACTPDGTQVLVLSKAGLQVIDTSSFEVVRTLPELKDGYELAVSFDGRRAYIATFDYLKRGYKTIFQWSKLAIAGKGGGLALLDLETWQVVRRVKCGLIGGLAVDPDDSRFFASDAKLQSLRFVDPATLGDLAVVDLTTAQSTRFQPRGVGVLPDGSKVYVVCADTSMGAATGAAGPDEYFCAVIESESQEVVKRIPLDAY